MKIFRFLFPPFARLRGPVHKNLPDGRVEIAWWYKCPKCDRIVSASYTGWPRWLRCPECRCLEIFPIRFFWVYRHRLARAFERVKRAISGLVELARLVKAEPEFAHEPPVVAHRERMTGQSGLW